MLHISNQSASAQENKSEAAMTPNSLRRFYMQASEASEAGRSIIFRWEAVARRRWWRREARQAAGLRAGRKSWAWLKNM